MRLFILAIVAGIGVLVGVALYVGQEIINPGTPNSKITARLAEEQEAVAVAENSLGKADDAEMDQYKSQLHTAQLPEGTTSFDPQAYRKQLPEIFQFPDQPAATPPATALQLDSSPLKAANQPALISQNNTSTPLPDAPSEGLSSQGDGDVRSDMPMIKQLAAPEHAPSVATATNPNVQLEVAPASDGRAARTRMIVSK